MYLRFLKWEFHIEIVAYGQKFLDWYIAPCDNHVWIGRIHVVFNRRPGWK